MPWRILKVAKKVERRSCMQGTIYTHSFWCASIHTQSNLPWCKHVWIPGIHESEGWCQKKQPIVMHIMLYLLLYRACLIFSWRWIYTVGCFLNVRLWIVSLFHNLQLLESQLKNDVMHALYIHAIAIIWIEITSEITICNYFATHIKSVLQYEFRSTSCVPHFEVIDYTPGGKKYGLRNII